MDTTWLGHFTFEALRDFSGLARILIILACGFLFHDKDSMLLSGDPHTRIETARRGLYVWCSIPEKARGRKGWQYQTDFARRQKVFPELVDAEAWFCRHFHVAMPFVLEYPDLVRKSYVDAAKDLDAKFDWE